MTYVYVLSSSYDNRFYVGMSLNVDRRLKEHNTGQCKSTKAYKPWTLIHIEEFPDRLAARKREKYLKSGYGKQWLKQKYSKVP